MSEIDIQFEEYSAQIRTSGAGLSALKYSGRDLIEPFQPDDTRFYRGDLLAPWPNRIRDGKYEVSGKTYSIPINEVERGTALHGLVNQLTWKVTQQSADSVQLEVDLPASDSYPSSLHCVVGYQLSEEGLEISIAALNTGSSLAPYGVSIHPYLIANSDSKVDEWTLTLNCNEALEVDVKRLLPLSVKLCEQMNFDFRKGSVIGERFVDHAFKVDASKPRAISVKHADKSGVLMTFDETSHWIQIHTADRDGGMNSRRSLAVEPMTCPPDAFRSGEDVIWLEAGDVTKSWWKIQNLKGGNNEE
jgi:aldose 1-epimerase